MGFAKAISFFTPAVYCYPASAKQVLFVSGKRKTKTKGTKTLTWYPVSTNTSRFMVNVFLLYCFKILYNIIWIRKASWQWLVFPEAILSVFTLIAGAHVHENTRKTSFPYS